jgi:hypothetical protein
VLVNKTKDGKRQVQVDKKGIPRVRKSFSARDRLSAMKNAKSPIIAIIAKFKNHKAVNIKEF